MQDPCMKNISQICISLLPATTMEHLWLLNLKKKKEEVVRSVPKSGKQAGAISLDTWDPQFLSI